MSDKYHINPETGRVNLCYAKHKCRFGLSPEEHYSSKEDARAAFEKENEDQTVVSLKKTSETPSEAVIETETEPEADKPLLEREPNPFDRNVNPEAYDEVEKAYADREEEARLVAKRAAMVAEDPTEDEDDTWRNRHTFATEHLPEALAIIDKANRKLDKYGIKERFEYELEEKFVNVTSAGGVKLSESRTTLTMLTPKISYNGMKFLATVTKEGDGFITRTSRDVELGGYRPDTQYCDHCKSNRERNKTYLIETAEGERKQIGSSCVEAYVGIKPAGLWSVGEDPLEGHSLSSGDTSPRNLNRPTVDMIAYGLAVSDGGENFISRSSSMNYGGTATADDIDNVMWGTNKDERVWREEMETRAAEYMASGKAQEVLEEIRKVEVENDYTANLNVASAGENVSARNVGILVSGLSAYRRKIIKEEREKIPSPSPGFAGEIKDKLVGKKATILNVKEIESYDDYARNMVTKSIITFRDEENHEMVWFASKVIPATPGSTVTFKGGSVKNHKQYNGFDQTGLTRVKFEED